MGEARRKKQLQALSFDAQLQYRADRIVNEVEFLSGTAVWQAVQMPDGETWIALLFKPTIWEHKDNRLRLKPVKKPSGAGDTQHKLISGFGEKKDESKTSNTDGLELQGDDSTRLSEKPADKPTQTVGK